VRCGLGVAEMTRFGMGSEKFRTLVGTIAGAILEDRTMKKEVRDLRHEFSRLRYCFGEADFPETMEALRSTL
jgi:glycine/serine hydroxymethyltransferase